MEPSKSLLSAKGGFRLLRASLLPPFAFLGVEVRRCIPRPSFLFGDSLCVCPVPQRLTQSEQVQRSVRKVLSVIHATTSSRVRSWLRAKVQREMRVR